MKTFLPAALFLIAIPAQAATCPTLTGKYTCPESIDISQEAKSDGTVVYTLDFGSMENGGKRKEVADGKKRRLDTSGWESYSYETRCPGSKLLEVLSAPPLDPGFNGDGGTVIMTTFETTPKGELKIDRRVNGKSKPTRLCAKAAATPANAKQAPAVTTKSGAKTIVDTATSPAATMDTAAQAR